MTMTSLGDVKAPCLCTMCGRESRENAFRGADIHGECAYDSRVTLNAVGSYGSDYLLDLSSYTMRICESCFAAIMLRCQLPVQIGDAHMFEDEETPAGALKGAELEAHLSRSQGYFVAPSLPEPTPEGLAPRLFDEEASRYGSAEDLFRVGLEALQLIWGTTSWNERDLISSRLVTRLSRLMQVLTAERAAELKPFRDRIADYYGVEFERPTED